MNQALVFVVVSLLLAVIMYWAKPKWHAVADNCDVFRYPPRLLKVVFLCCFIPIVMAVFICLVSIPEFPLGSAVWLIVLGTVGSILAYVFYIHIKEFSVAVSHSDITVTRIKDTELIRFEDIEKVIYLHGIRGSYIRLYANNRTRPLTLYDSLGDFDQLANLIKSGVESRGVSYQRMDVT